MRRAVRPLAAVSSLAAAWLVFAALVGCGASEQPPATQEPPIQEPPIQEPPIQEPPIQEPAATGPRAEGPPPPPPAGSEPPPVSEPPRTVSAPPGSGPSWELCLDEAAAQLGRSLQAALPTLGEGLAQKDGRPILQLGRLVNATLRRVDPELLEGQLVDRLAQRAPGVALRALEGGEAPPGLYGAGLPLLLVGRLSESREEGPGGARVELLAELRALDPLAERVVALALAGRPPWPFDVCLPGLRRKLAERGAQGWPEPPRVRLGPLKNASSERLDLEAVGAWLERELLEAGLEVVAARGDRLPIEALREAAAMDGVEVDPTRAPPTSHLLTGEVQEEGPGQLWVILRLVSLQDRQAVLTVRQKVRRG